MASCHRTSRAESRASDASVAHASRVRDRHTRVATASLMAAASTSAVRRILWDDPNMAGLSHVACFLRFFYALAVDLNATLVLHRPPVDSLSPKHNGGHRVSEEARWSDYLDVPDGVLEGRDASSREPLVTLPWLEPLVSTTLDQYRKHLAYVRMTAGPVAWSRGCAAAGPDYSRQRESESRSIAAMKGMFSRNSMSFSRTCVGRYRALNRKFAHDCVSSTWSTISDCSR